MNPSFSHCSKPHSSLSSLEASQEKPSLSSRRPTKIVCQPAPPPGEGWEVGEEEPMASPLFAVTPHSKHKLEENVAFSPFAPTIPRSPNQMQTNIRSEKYLRLKEGASSSLTRSQVLSSSVSIVPSTRHLPALRHLRPNNMRGSLPPLGRTFKPPPPPFSTRWDEHITTGPLRLVLPFLSFTSVLTLQRVNKKLQQAREIKRRLRETLIIGLNRPVRMRFWQHLTEQTRGNERAAAYFVAGRRCPQEIKNDILRTPSVISGLQLSKAHQEAMMRILGAVHLFNTDVGYCQGMNYIAGLLIHLLDSEEDIFWLFNTLLSRFKLKKLLMPGLRKLKLRCFQLACLLQNYLPEVHERLEEVGVSTEMYAAKWFVTLLSYELPFEQLAKVWDLFFQSGWKVIFRVILALLSVAKRELVSAESGTITGLLHSLGRREISGETLLKVAFGFKVTHRLLKDLKLLKSRKIKGRFQLLPSQNRKLDWVVTPLSSPQVLSPCTEVSEDGSLASRLLSKVLYLFKGEESKETTAELDSTICLDELQVPTVEDVSLQLPIKDLNSGEVHYIDLSQEHCFICGAASHSSRYCTSDTRGALWVFPSSQVP